MNIYLIVMSKCRLNGGIIAYFSVGNNNVKHLVRSYAILAKPNKLLLSVTSLAYTSYVNLFFVPLSV